MMHEEEEIGFLADECLALGRGRCEDRIEQKVARAVAHGIWDEMHKWQRVRLRVHRLRRIEDAVTVSGAEMLLAP